MSLTISQRVSCALAVYACFATAAAAATNSSLVSTAMNSITANEAYAHVSALADDVYEGRAAGSRGGHAASQYIIQKVRNYGFEPAGNDGSFVQTFDRDWRNVLLSIPGDDPELAKEVIVVGAHYDHVGYGSSRNSYGPIGKIHNGADDNASGVAVLLETIDAFARSGLRTRRSILFAFWDGEERNLVGSRYWVAHPTIPLDRVKLAFTVDMVGRLRKGQLYVLGTRSGYGLRRLMSNATPLVAPAMEPHAGSAPLWLDFSWEIQSNSDHWSFYERQIPGVLLHTGLHSDYHRPSDDVERIERAGLRDVAQYLFAALVTTANEDRLPTFRRRVTRENESMRRSLERPLARRTLANWPADEPRPRLGLSWREDAAEPGSVFVTRVVDGTPAAPAGIAVNDRIYELDGKTFADANEFQVRIAAALDSAQSEIAFLVERRGKLRTITVSLPVASPVPRPKPAD